MIRSIDATQPLLGQDLRALTLRVMQTLLCAPADRLAAQELLERVTAAAASGERQLHTTNQGSITNQNKQAQTAALTALQLVRTESDERLARQIARIDTSLAEARKTEQREHLNKLELIEQTAEEDEWTADTMFESQEPRAMVEFEELRAATDRLLVTVAEQVEAVESILKRAHVSRPVVDEIAPSPREQPAAEVLAAQAQSAAQVVAQLRGETRARILRLIVVHICAVVAWGAIGGAIALLCNRWTDASVPVGAVIGLGLGLAAQAMLYLWAGGRLRRIAGDLSAVEVIAATAARESLKNGMRRRTELEKVILEQHRTARAAARNRVRPASLELDARHLRQQNLISENAATLRRNSIAQHTAAITTAERACAEANSLLHAASDQQLSAEAARHQTRMSAILASDGCERALIVSRWIAARDHTVADIAAISQLDASLFAPWKNSKWETFDGVTAATGAAKLGSLRVRLESIAGAVSNEPMLAWPAGTPKELLLPVVLSLPSHASLLIECANEGRPAGIALLQEAMLRILTALPPGSARFTIIDPVGLGEGFAAFMHLADEAEHLIGERIWTDGRHIEQRLTDLCDHMETVIQKFLRNEFANLDEYNRQAGEIAEPYRFLVFCDFPANVSEIAARRLASIVNSGARCGVFTILLRDTRQAVPAGLDLQDIRDRSLCMQWRDGRYAVDHEPMDKFEFTTEQLPSNDQTMELLRRIARTAKKAKRVEVPFSAIAPRDDAIWSESAAQTISVALGRSGASRLQQITLGIGTSQHALIAGKTGSGKSTLFHALITNLALRYSPDEAELWLIDFKKGVEFRTYATNALPHARAVAVESDREFGLSVLRGLDAELRRRGEIFREKSVQDLTGYRRLHAQEIIPRSLLIVDEFQELFTEDDKISEESALLLDRLVRQGRAFGMHVILGSQTLGGAYSIARTTMGQMAIRIALQCNEADSQLILSDDNVAARLLSRPGEAIYNDAGGLVEGNNPFQVVWLPDDERDRMLARVRAHCANHPPKRRSELILFEGNAPAHLEANAPMRAARARASGQPLSGPALLWFGDAISIKDPTSVALRRQTGTNIMLVGQRDDAALAIAAAAMVSLASQVQPGQAQVLLLDGTPPDDPTFGHLAALHTQLRLGGEAGGLRDCEGLLTRATAELARRQSDLTISPATCLVLVHAIHRFRGLRRNEDDYSVSSSTDAALTADRQLAALLRDGPALGMHVMVTCDSATNLARCFDRNSIREFEWRMLFQVSASDSSTLIDSPVASRLGAQRVLLHSEESGTQEKFRHYAWPTQQWVTTFFARG
ncbi:MAG: cell division protein FtsK [Phycisphaerales bacterium]|nr:cell division protein FtsK [Phycisphaerales bacterium]